PSGTTGASGDIDPLLLAGALAHGPLRARAARYAPRRHDVRGRAARRSLNRTAYSSASNDSPAPARERKEIPMTTIAQLEAPEARDAGKLAAELDIRTHAWIDGKPVEALS